jgi:glycosyltransferase involved in cell wall biosynthesis
MERALLRRFTVVGCMSPLGLRYLARNYALGPGQATGVVSLWGPQTLAANHDPDAVRVAHGLPQRRPIAVFGGQITHGRGIEDILASAGLARQGGSELLFVFVGRGPLTPLVEAAAGDGSSNVRLVGELGRDDYLDLVAACDVGVVATVADVDVPTFPSKTIDYLRAGLPVVASVEASTDFDAFVEAHGFGLAVTAGEPARLLQAIETVLADDDRRRAMAANGRRTLREVFNVEIAVTDMLAQIRQAQGAETGADRPADAARAGP